MNTETSTEFKRQPMPTGDGVPITPFVVRAVAEHVSHAQYNNPVTMMTALTDIAFVLKTKMDKSCDIHTATGMYATATSVAGDIQKRSEAGAKKYGTVLKTNNGRDALRDCYEEVLDAIQYMRQHIEEVASKMYGDSPNGY